MVSGGWTPLTTLQQYPSILNATIHHCCLLSEVRPIWSEISPRHWIMLRLKNLRLIRQLKMLQENYRLSLTLINFLLVLFLLGRFNCLTSPLLSLFDFFFQLFITFHHNPVQHPLSPDPLPSIFHSITVFISDFPLSVCPIHFLCM